MSKWLYKTEFVSFIRVPETLTLCGSLGWELVSVIPHSHAGPPTHYDLIFKKMPIENRLTSLEETVKEDQ